MKDEWSNRDYRLTVKEKEHFPMTGKSSSVTQAAERAFCNLNSVLVSNDRNITDLVIKLERRTIIN